MAKLSSFNITRETQNLPETICNLMKDLSSKGEHLLEWDIDNLVFDRDFIREQCYISNTVSEKELPNSIRNIALKFDGIKDMVIDGKGNTILYNNRCVQIECLKCENVTFKNFTFDYINPTVSEFTVVDKGLFYIDVKINQDTSYTIKNDILHFNADDGSGIVMQECDPVNGFTRRKGVYGWKHDLMNDYKCKKLDNGVIRLKTLSTKFKVGNIYQLAWIRRDGTGFLMDRCKNMSIENCRFKFMHGMGVLAQITENIRIENTDFLPNKENGRTTTTFADVMHFVNCKGDIVVKNCKADGTRDDVINNHGVHLKVVKVAENRVQLKYCHPQTYGFNCFFENDEVEAINSTSLVPYATATVKLSKMISPRIIEIELDNIKGNEIKVGDVIENVTWTASLYVDNLETFNIPTRGILVTTRKPIVIKNSTFHKCFMPCIHISDDARSWYESGYVRDVLIENNVFEDCFEYAVSLKPENIGSNAVHKNIRIVGNKFIAKNNKVLTAKCVDGLVFDKNEISCTGSPDIALKNVVNDKINL